MKGDQKEICKIILAKGDLQVSEKERQAQQDAMFKGTDRRIQVQMDDRGNVSVGYNRSEYKKY